MSQENESCLAWLERSLQRLRPEGQEKIVGYLEAVLKEVLFETKVHTKGAGERPLERHPNRGGQPRLVRAVWIETEEEGASGTLG